jgi:hypothetical protein
MALPNWSTTGDWEVLRLGGIPIPGRAKVKGKLPSGLDVKKPKGGKKATIKDDGDPPGELDVELSMDHEQLVAFAEIVPILRAVTKGGARDPLKVEHPEAALWGIHNVTVGDIDSDHPAAGGRKVITFKLIEWAPAPSTVAASKKTPEANTDAADWQRLKGNRTPDVPLANIQPSRKAADNI